MAGGGLFLVFGSSRGGKRAVALWLDLREEEEGFALLEGGLASIGRAGRCLQQRAATSTETSRRGDASEF